MLGDTLSRALHASVNVLEVLKMDLEEILSGDDDDKFYGASNFDPQIRRTVPELKTFHVLLLQKSLLWSECS